MLHVWIDELTPCLKDTITGDLIPTEVTQIVRKSFLKKFSKDNGWYVDWVSLLDEGCEVYALVLKGTVDIQGMIAIKRDDDAKALYMAWAVAAPYNNPQLTDSVKYQGIGGHLFAIAADKSYEYGYDGFMYGFAANEQLLKHYIERFDALYVGMRHPFHFVMGPEQSSRLIGEYDYEWTDAKI